MGLFKIIEQWVPFKSNLKTGLLIEPNYLERPKQAKTIPTKIDGQTTVPGSYTTIEGEISTYTSSQADKFEGSKLFKMGQSSVGGGNVSTTNNLLNTTDDDGQRKEQGTNTTIKLNKLYKFEKEHAQAPIIPNSTGSKQLKRISNTPLGNIQKGRISRRYYRSLAIGNQNNLLKA